MESPNNPYPCHVTPTVSSEQFIPEHIFSYMMSGSMVIYDGNKEYNIQTGDYCFAKRNHLAKYVKNPPEGGQFKTVSIFFSQDFLKAFSSEYAFTSAHADVSKDVIIKLDPDPLFKNYVQSIMPYLNLTGTEHENFLLLKKKEILLILLKTNPDLKNVLLEFSDPGKIDLESFMNKNFKFNVSLKRFSYLTGRSLATFKRDFEKIFKISPSRWLLQRRLQEAYYQIKELGKRPSEVYLDVGFEDFSHFTYAFRQAYGQPPSKI
jgi:AraC-like DNA-binding protein